ncbi:MAG TPA: sulfite exporter TauE/SafE family protein [Prolixibacteraceae bacterium]|nr:sulfite exporter TauE/SafE family protein [Prolixibacteraceae bacterium]
MEFLSSLPVSSLQWAVIMVCGMLIGMSKVGVPGVSMIAVPALAFIFGAKQSTGVLLPILMMADIFGVAYYRRHANWSKVIKVLPWAIVGVLLALWIGEIVNDKQFKNLIAVLVFISIGLMLWQDKRKGTHFFPDKWWFAASMGILGGFATMIGNVAGPVFAIYLLAMHLPKNNFIGTGAWFFLIINISKFPLQLFVWKNISIETLTIDLMTLPAIALGAVLGFKFVKLIPEHTYRGFVIVITVISAFLLLL